MNPLLIRHILGPLDHFLTVFVDHICHKAVQLALGQGGNHFFRQGGGHAVGQQHPQRVAAVSQLLGDLGQQIVHQRSVVQLADLKFQF